MNNYSEMITIDASKYIYRVVHRIMEGDCQHDHGPFEVNFKKLQVSKYPVTNAQYYDFIKETGYTPQDDHNFLKHWVDKKIPNGYENHPVIWISRDDAMAYATWKGGRLPYDFEWQYIAAGKQKLVYPWGNIMDKSKCNCTKELTAVDAYPTGAGPFGTVDMCGNAWEWLCDEVDDGMHLFTFLRGGSYYKPVHFWHVDNGPRKNNHHLKFQLLNEGQNRCATISFRFVREL